MQYPLREIAEEMRWRRVYRVHYWSRGRALGLKRSNPLTRQVKLTKMAGFHRVNPPSSSGPFGSN